MSSTIPNLKVMLVMQDTFTALIRLPSYNIRAAVHVSLYYKYSITEGQIVLSYRCTVALVHSSIRVD